MCGRGGWCGRGGVGAAGGGATVGAAAGVRLGRWAERVVGRPHDEADQERRIFYLTVLIVPGLILLAGVQTWWRRR